MAMEVWWRKVMVLLKVVQKIVNVQREVTLAYMVTVVLQLYLKVRRNSLLALYDNFIVNHFPPKYSVIKL